MKLTRISAEGQNLITGYGEDHIAINGVRHGRSLLVMPSALHVDWPVRSAAELKLEHFTTYAGIEDCILLLGTGPRQCFPPMVVLRDFARACYALDVMDNSAACRTYNVLMSEGRPVAAALIVPHSAA